MKFDYCPHLSAKPEICLYDDFKALISLPVVRELIAQHRADPSSGAKRSLPAFCFHATYGGRTRAARHATPSGLYMLDLDHVPAERLEGLERDLAETARRSCESVAPLSLPLILLLHVTPSGQGLRLVCKAQRTPAFTGCRSLADYQRRAAQLLGVADLLDEVAHDLARLSFCPCADDVLFMSPRLFTDTAEVTDFAPSQPAPQRRAAAPQPALPQSSQSSPAAPQAPLQEEYRGRPLRDIFARYFELQGGLPAEGERNARFYAATRDLRYICDFNPQVLAAHMPDVGLSAQEVYAVCDNACQSSRATRLPAAVSQALDLLEPAAAPAAAPAASEPLTRLPLLVRELVAAVPAPFARAAVLAVLPVMGTLATRVRARYLDGELHSPSFITLCTAEQASGKSFARRLVQALMHTVMAEDAEARAAEARYHEELRRKRNAKELPADPRVKVTMIPVTVSIAKLLQRLDYAAGDHLFSFAEELDTLIKTNRGGAWSEKNDIYRNAFDNAAYGQDYMSDNSYSATLPIFYNMLLLGTPRQRGRFFADVENGLVSRVCFASLPDQFGKAMPPAVDIPAKTQQRIDAHVARLRAAHGVMNLDFLFAPLQHWLEEHRQRALRENNRARDIFRRRAAVIGFRAAMTVYPLYASPKKAQPLLADFALCVANLVLEGQLDYAGATLNRVLSAPGSERSGGFGTNIFAQLPDRFDASELAAQLVKRGMKSPPRQLIYVWLREGLITKVQDSPALYEKTESKDPNKTTPDGTDDKTH